LTETEKKSRIIYHDEIGGCIWMDAKKVFSQIMLERNMSYDEMAAKLGMNTQSLRNKISRGNYGLSDFINMMDLLECDIIVQTRDTKKIFY
jgi:hypothetical protein